MSLTASDKPARDRAATSIAESLAVEAGAGTGKTTLLVTRVMNLLRRGRVGRPPRPVRMDEIVAITFTEKAAGELKARLRDELEKAVASGRFNDEPLGGDERRRLAEALESLDRASVSTIHSFCAALIRERPVEAGIDPGRATMDKLTEMLLQEEAWERWCEQALDRTDDAALAEMLRLDVKVAPSSGDDRSQSLRELAGAIVNNRDLLDSLPQRIDEEAAWREWQVRIAAQIAAMAECQTHLKPGKTDKTTRLARTFQDAWESLAKDTVAEARRGLLGVDIDENLGGDQKKWREPAQLERLRSLLDELRDSLLPDARAALTHNLVVDLAERLTQFVGIYQRLKEDRGLLDFQDLLLVARNLLKSSPEAREYFRDRFRFLLMDEFQDTDPLQAEVSELLAGDANDDGRLFLVGDPKQSIYRFRRADIEMYEASVSRLGDARRLRIQQNFRSGANVVAWVNRVFEKLIVRPPDGRYQPDYVRLLPGPRADELPGKVVLLYPPDPSGDGDLAGQIGDIRFREGCTIARFIQQAVAEEWPIGRGDGRLRLGDVAILLPQMTGIEQYEEAFRACDLKYHIHGGRWFFKRVEIKSLTSVVTAVENPEDEIAVVAALRSPFFGCSDENLLRHALAGGRFNYLRPRQAAAGPVGAAFELFARLHRDRNSRPVAHVLVDFLDATKGLESFLTKPQGEARVANLMKVVESARAMAETAPVTFRGFVRWLRERQAARDEESESPMAEPGDESVEVLTVHAAKGLEFPMTVIADLNGTESKVEEQLVLDRASGELHLRCGRLCTRHWRAGCELERRRKQAERLRLFYVAATRARDYLVLPVGWRKPKRGSNGMLAKIEPYLPACSDPPWGQRFDGMFVQDTRLYAKRGWPEAQYAPRVDLDKLAGDPAADEFVIERTEWSRQLDATLARARPGREVVRASDLAQEGTRAAAARRRTSEGPAGAAFGSLVHRLMELHLTRATGDTPLAGLASRLAAEFGLTGADGESAAALVAAAANTATVERLRSARRLFCEVPFTFFDADRIVEGRIDALAEEPAGLLVVDFKTDSVEPGGEQARADEYAPQLRAYAAAVTAATGRPVHEAIVFFLRTMQAVKV